MNTYNVFDWYWLVKETNKYWSSKASTYVDIYDNDSLTIIDTEYNLSVVLAQYNLQGPIVLVPTSVTPYQAKAVLLNAGLFQQVDQYIQSLGPNTLEYLAWNSAQNFYRESPFIVSIGTQLGLTPNQIDQLFIEASKIS